MDELAAARLEIDKVDEALFILIEQRVNLSRSIQAMKRQAGVQVYDPDRENEILAKAPSGDVARVIAEVLKVCKESL